MKRPAFQFYPADFLVGTAMMSAEEVGCYIRLLCYQWDSNGLPNDDAQLARLGGCHGNAVALIRHKFGMCQDGLLRNARLEDVRQEQEQYREKQRENAKKRWVGNATAMPPHDSGIKAASNWHMPNACSSSSPSPSNTSTKVEVGVEFPANLQSADFGAAWESYLAYRKSSRLKSLAPASIQAQLKNLSDMGHDEAIEAINQSIANGWQGIFPPKNKKPAQAKVEEVEQW